MKIYIQIDDAYVEFEIDRKLYSLMIENSSDKLLGSVNFIKNELTPYIEVILTKLVEKHKPETGRKHD